MGVKPSDDHFLQALFLAETQLRVSGKKDSPTLLQILPYFISFYDAQTGQNISGQIKVLENESPANLDISEPLARSAIEKFSEQSLVPRASELVTIQKLAKILRTI